MSEKELKTERFGKSGTLFYEETILRCQTEDNSANDTTLTSHVMVILAHSSCVATRCPTCLSTRDRLESEARPNPL